MSSTIANAPATTTARWLTPVELVALGAIWGASFLFMRIAAHDFGSFALVEVRLSLGAIILMPFLWRARAHFQASHWLKLAGIAAINSAIPFTLFAWGAQRAPAGIGAICNATAVMFTALIAFMFFGEQITRRRALGLVIGFIGAAVLASGKTAGDSLWPAAVAGILAAFLYGIGANLTRRHLSFAPPSSIAAATLVCGAVMLAPLAFATWPEAPIPEKSWLSAAMLGVLCTGAAYLLFYRLIYRIGAPGAATVTYLVPLFGVLWAWLFLDESLTPTMAIAGALIFGGVGLSQKK
jgi:drug/metabolite transporter (DMT)-like permease